MKVLAFMFFSFFFFFNAEDTAIETTATATATAPESIVCVEYGGGSFSCNGYDDGGNCLVIIFESDQVMALGDDC